MIRSVNDEGLPLGELVENATPAPLPERRLYKGRYVDLSPLDPQKDLAELYRNYIIKGRNRDTAWFAMLDRDWPAVKANMKRWLYSDENTVSLAELNQPLLRATGF